MDPESIYLEHLPTIERIAAFVARRFHLNPDDTAEFVQIVRVRLWENDYAIIRKFEGRSSFTTYLTTVIIRLFHQWRVERWGKWRPSAAARRLGDTAIMLERLLTRDGYTFSEAVKVMTTHAGAKVSVSELEAIYVRLPSRHPRPMEMSGEVSPDAAAVESDAGTRIESRDRERTAQRIMETIDAVETLEAEDRLILQLRFRKAMKVPEIARTLGLDQKKIYKRLDKLFATLRRDLEAAGVKRADVDAVLVSGDQDIRLGVLSDEENGPSGPSNDGGEDEKGGKGRLP
jgi:RNA polymerase sigma factor for flagellar operon FliA